MIKKLTLNKGDIKFCLIFLCVMLGQSCRKDSLMPNSSDNIANVRVWYANEFKKSTQTLVSANGYSFPFSVKPKWELAQFSKLENQTGIYIVPIETDLPLELRLSVNPILVIQEKGSEYKAKTIGDEENNHFDSKKNKNTTYDAKSLYQTAFVNNQKKLSFATKPGTSKLMTANSESQISNDITTMNTKPPGKGDDCIDWYLVERDGDGVVLSEEFVGRTCGIDQMPGGGGGGGGPKGTPGNPNDFGLDPKCLNCQIPESNFEAFLNYLKGMNYMPVEGFQTTITIGDQSYQGNMVEIYSNGSLVGSFFTPNSSSEMFTMGIHYSLGFRGSDGNGPVPPSPGYGLTGLSFPTTYYNGKTTPFPLPPGSVTYTTPGQDLLKELGITDPEAKTFFKYNTDFANALANYYSNNKTQENAEYVTWAIGYILNNRYLAFEDFKNQFLPAIKMIADPDADNWTDSDDEVLFDPDQSVYQQYQDNQPWPTIKRDDVLPFENFVAIRKRKDDPTKYENCLVLAKEQLGTVGYTCSGYLPGDQTFSIYTTQDGVKLAETKKAISYIITSLTQKIPVLIGVDNRAGAPSANKDHSTDHYVVIVGMGNDEKGKYFQFTDNATNNPATGASYSNRLYYNSGTGKITGKTAIADYRNLAGMHDYIVTQVRKSIKK